MTLQFACGNDKNGAQRGVNYITPFASPIEKNHDSTQSYPFPTITHPKTTKIALIFHRDAQIQARGILTHLRDGKILASCIYLGRRGTKIDRREASTQVRYTMTGFRDAKVPASCGIIGRRDVNIGRRDAPIQASDAGPHVSCIQDGASDGSAGKISFFQKKSVIRKNIGAIEKNGRSDEIWHDSWKIILIQH